MSRRCREETERYHQGRPHDDRYAFELFRRALTGDQVSWEELYALYQGQVLAWCSRAGPTIDPEEAAAIAWEKFWRNYTLAKLVAAGCAAKALSYLKLCTHSAVVDVARTLCKAVPYESDSAAGTDPSTWPDDPPLMPLARAELWQLVQFLLHDERERAYVHLAFQVDMRSAEIAAVRPDLFASVGEVYRTARNVVERLRRSERLKAWLED